MVSREPQGEQTPGPERRRRLVLMLASRTAVMTALLGSTILFNLRAGVPSFSTTQMLLYGTVLAVYLSTAGYWVYIRSVRSQVGLGFHLQINIAFDVLVATVLVYVSGGVESPFTFLYALPVIHSAVLYPRGGIFLTAGLSCLFLGALFVLENQQILSSELEGRARLPPSAGRVVYLLALNYTVFFAVAWLSSYLAEQLRRTGRELRRTESDLEELIALNRDIVLSMRSGLMVVDPQGYVSLLNPVAEEILGVSGKKVLGLGVEEIFPSLVPLLEQPIPDRYSRLDADHQDPSDGRTIPIGLTLSVLKSPEGAQTGILVHMQDLTHQKKLEESVKQSERMAALGGMATGMAHEIRNPLASISGSVQMLKSSAGVGDQERLLMDIILRETNRLDTLLADFLAYARPKEPNPRQCWLKELVEETVSVFLHDGKNQPFQVICELEEVRARVDPDQMRQVLWNLLTNAAQATQDKGQIHVGIRSEVDVHQGRQVLIEVTNQGPEISPDIRERIFDPFFTTREQGSGLGLATVSRIVEAHGGSIQLVCPEEGGSRFVVRLPGVCDE